jgi:hypothetical protein
VTTDPWIARLYVIAQIVALGVCGALVALGHNSSITDIFIASSASLLGTSGYKALKGKSGPPYQSTEDAQ